MSDGAVWYNFTSGSEVSSILLTSWYMSTVYESFYKSGDFFFWGGGGGMKNNTNNFDLFYFNLKSEH